MKKWVIWTFIALGVFVVVLLVAIVTLLKESSESIVHLPIGSINTTFDGVTLEKMKSCEQASDCSPVGCGCSCSGCGGFSYQDIINKKYSGQWYSKMKCKPAEICPLVCCSQKTIVCENSLCGVIDG